MNNSEYRYKTISTDRGVELQEKYVIEQNGQRIVVSYRIVDGENISKSYFKRGNAIKKYVDTYLKKPRVAA